VIGNASDTLYEELIAVQIEFVREYYATESSRRQGITYTPKGWEGCAEKITKLNILAESITITDKLFGDTTITGVDKNNLTSYRCQEKYGCDCRSALSITSIDSLVTLFNSQHKTQTRVFISEKYDKTPFVFFVKKKDLESFNGKKIKMQLHMSNGKLIDAESNKIVL
jgi:hypothetical protein